MTDKEQLKQMLAELFKDGTISFTTEYTDLIIVTIDGEEVQKIELKWT